MIQNRQIALATYDPRSGGGVRSVMEFVYDILANEGGNPYLVYNALPWGDCTTFHDLLQGELEISVSEEQYGNMNGVQIGRGLPELLLTNYLFNRSEWRSALSEADAALVLGGPCLAGVPLARSETQYAVWMGTTIEDEREVQKRQFRLGRRLRYELARPVLRRQERQVLRNAAQILVQSSYTKRKVINRHGIDPDTVNVLPFPVDIEKFSPGEPKTNPHEIVFVGRLNDPRKNTELLLESFVQVLEYVPDAKLTLVGSEPEQRHFEKIDEVGIQEKVSTPGNVDSVVPYLRRAAVFAFPSRQEGFGIAALEALACGTPVVSTKCGGPSDFVLDGETGYLVSDEAVSEFCGRITKLLKDDERRLTLGSAGRALVETRFKQSIVRDGLVRTLESIS